MCFFFFAEREISHVGRLAHFGGPVAATGRRIGQRKRSGVLDLGARIGQRNRSGGLIICLEIFYLLSRMLSAHEGLINGKF